MSTRLNAQPNVTPMIDVMLVLLVAFLVALPATRVIEARLPQPYAGGRDSEHQVALTLQRDGSFDLDGERIPNEAALGERLRARYVGRPVKLLFVIAPGELRYERVIAAMDSARGAGIPMLGVTPRR